MLRSLDRRDGSEGNTQPASGHPWFLLGGGELARLITEHDWASTSAGPIEAWPSSLQHATSMVLRSKVAMVLLWGTDGVMIYNDAYGVFAGGRHPDLLGSPVRQGWPEAAEFNDHVMKAGLAGESLAFRDTELTLFRDGTAEQVWMNLDYSPVVNEDGHPAGVLAIVNETTAKVTAERWLTSERDRQRQMFQQAPGFIAVLAGPDHVFELTNAAYLQLVGHRNVSGMPVRDALPEIEGQGYFELLDEVFASGKPFVGTSLRAELQRTPENDKEEVFLDLIYQPMRDPSGKVVGIFVQGQDVTERVLAERSLRRSETQFRTLAEAMPNHVWTAGPDGLLDWFNTRVYEYAGEPHEALAGNGWTTLVHPDDLPAAAEAWAKALSCGGPYETEFRLRRLDGQYRWHIARAVPLTNGRGQIAQWIGTNTDIDDQKRSAQALFESERRLQLSQSAAGIASLELDIATGNVIGSDRFWNLWGLSKRESVHISVLEEMVIPPDRAIRSNQVTREQGTAVPSVEYRIRRQDDGELRWLYRSIDFVRDGAGKPTKMFGVMQDITDRKDTEARQNFLVHELEHRIKNILAMVTAIASQTLRDTDIDSARSSLITRMKALANAHDLLNKTRWTSASMAEVVKATTAVFPIAQISMSGPHLPLDPKRALSLALAVNELATNALKYGALSTPHGSVAIEWAVDPTSAQDLTWRWKETGGPPVEAPLRRGFGSLLLRRVLATDFGGKAQLEYASDGLEYVLTAPSIPTSNLRAER